jgi:hypothetical protein
MTAQVQSVSAQEAPCQEFPGPESTSAEYRLTEELAESSSVL